MITKQVAGLIIAIFSFLSLFAFSIRAAEPGAVGNLSRLEVLSGGYPKAFLFWTTTRRMVMNPALDWRKEFVALQGVASPSDYWANYLEFKDAHPTKLTYLFTQGYVFSEFPSQFDPIDRSQFFAGHWVHFEGCRVTSDIPAQPGVTEIAVETPQQFRIQQVRRSKLVHEDVVLCRLNAQGQPDWHAAEQVRLVAVDEGKKTLRIQRGLYGTKPIAFAANQTWAAAHAYQPWGSGSGISWIANYSPYCPKDTQGRTAADILVEQFAALFQPGGRLHAYDGLEFDAMMGIPESAAPSQRRYDTDGDGKADNGYREGVNVFGIGVYDFARRLRERLGPDKLIMGDGSPKAGHQRCFGIFNGIESEWWPQWGDLDVSYWSSGINTHEFWKQNSHPPHFSYMVHKIGGEDRQKWIDTPFHLHRLVMAAAQFVDAAITCFYSPQAEPGEMVGIFDELRLGAEHKPGWLGQPLGPTVTMALQQEDLLEGAGKRLGSDFVKRFASEGCRIEAENAALRISANPGAKRLTFALTNLPCQGENLYISLNLKAPALRGYPEAYARHATVSLSSGQPNDLNTYASGRWFNAGFYFRKVSGSQAVLRFDIEGSEPVWLANLTVHAYPDVRYRVFEHGLVMANPSDQPFAFDLNAIMSEAPLCRLKGSSQQDPKINNGQRIGGTVTLGPRDGLFLSKTIAAVEAPKP